MKKSNSVDNLVAELRNSDGVWSRIRDAEAGLETVKQFLPRAADEIEKLNKENIALKAILKPISVRQNIMKPKGVSKRAEAVYFLQRADDFLIKASQCISGSRSPHLRVARTEITDAQCKIMDVITEVQS